MHINVTITFTIPVRDLSNYGASTIKEAAQAETANFNAGYTDLLLLLECAEDITATFEGVENEVS